MKPSTYRQKEMDIYHPPGSNCLVFSVFYATAPRCCRLVGSLANSWRTATCTVDFQGSTRRLLEKMKFPPVPGSSCNQRAKSRRHQPEKGKFLSAPFVAFQGAALRVPPDPYRQQMTIVAINNFAAAVVAAMVALLASNSLPRRPCPGFNLREWAAIEGCTIQHKEIPNQSAHVDFSRSVPAFQL